MSDPLPPAAPESVVVPPNQPAKPAKRPGPIRTTAVILLLVLSALLVLSFPFVIEPWVIGQVRTQLRAQGMTLSDDSKLDLSLFGGRITGENVMIAELTDDKPGEEIFRAGALRADVAVMDSITGFDLIIDELIATDASGSLRRRPDGSVPIITPPGEGTDWSKVNWYDYYQKLSDYLKKRKEEQERQEEEQKKDPSKQPEPQADPNRPDAIEWPAATRYKPPSTPGDGPRVLVRTLEISGTKLGLPDETPFDVASFQISGRDVCVVQEKDETMTLTAKVQTTGAGPIDIDLKRAPGVDGTLTAKAPQLPVQALSNPAISGDALAKYGAAGLTNIDISTAWSGWDLTGTITNLIKDLTLSPQPGAGGEAQQLAQIVNNLKGQTLTWPMKLGGTLYAPQVTDTGISEIQGSMTDAVKGAATQKATEEATKAIDKQLEQNPELKGVKDKAGDLFKGLKK